MEKNRIDVSIDKNAIKDEGNGVISFNKGLTLSDESTQKNGTRYDIGSMDISQYDGKVFADHNYEMTGLIGRAYGVAKRAKRLVAEGVRFAVNENPMALFVYEMVRNGWATDVSIGTMGEIEEDDKTGEYVYNNARLIEFSFVGIGNNDNAHLNAAAKNAYEHAEAEGLDTKELDNYLEAKHIKVKENEMADKDTTVVADKPDEPVAPAPEPPVATPAPASVDENSIKEMVEKAIKESTKPLQDKLEQYEKNAFDKAAKEPEFTDAKNGVKNDANEFNAMDWKELTQLQVESFWKADKQNDAEAQKTLNKINDFHKNELKAKGLAKNAVGMSDFGNFVTNPELITQIQGFRTDYSEILGTFGYRDTNSLRMSWLARSGDIDMTSVEMCDDGEDGNLKPISDYTATAKSKDLEELAAVTPVCSAANIFMAVDILEDVAAGYRNSYDRNLARGVIGTLELAAEDNDEMSFSFSGNVDTAAHAATGLEEIRKAFYAIQQNDNGVTIMNYATFGYITGLLFASGNGGALAVRSFDGGVNTIWGRKYILVPNDLMPTIGDTATYKTYELDGANVTVNHAIFNADPAFFRGRQNGGLRYDLSTEAAYEENGTVKSAYQRNEIVLRGSHFRGTAYTDNSRVSAVRAAAVIS